MRTRGRPAKSLWKEGYIPTGEVKARVTLSERLEAEYKAGTVKKIIGNVQDDLDGAIESALMPGLQDFPTHKCGCVRQKSQIFCGKHGKY